MRPIIRWLARLAAEVPPDVATCEFDCSRSRCGNSEYLLCERRRFREALTRSDPSGESMQDCG